MRAALATAAVVGAAAVAALGLAALRPGAAPAEPPKRVFAFLSRADGLELRRLAQIGRRISVLAPNWYELDVDSGALHEPWQREPVLRAARRAGVPVWPVVNARTGGSAAIDDPLARARTVAAIVRVASDPAYAGVTLDIEELLATQRDAYTALVRDVAAALAVRRRRLAVYAPRPTRGGSALAYDWPALAAAADLLLVATYNETGPQGPPGPLDSSAGYADVLARAAAVSQTKTVPILGAIGYAWPQTGPGQMVSVIDAEQRRTRCRAPRSVADGNASYRCRGETVYHATSAGLRERARAAGAAGFRWMALFSLGREPRSFWDGMPRVRR
ncbi:glycosyl hydrolase family 18 protein [Conexibacter woesei]|uniref:Glycosyl hydrolase-like protein n=1 Tax=Conexibacter woesei (strain DSM 14684 / CCUG 47730 / CIP 108061 / JCM 11494 / NBRC 100937 / ID131577) TaxID=469383 RepID=D3EYT4_CONWI|nr:glycosyl hydrolase-like protein [Conexibacter woesei]ADB49808.1 glycosyl hydrolase-like protein [Conexibacter woesei DSM 14684]